MLLLMLPTIASLRADTMTSMNKQSPATAGDNTSDTIGVADNLTPYVKRINAAVAYTGQNDHEDVRSILNDYRKAELTSLVAKLPEKVLPDAPSDWSNGYDAGVNDSRAVIQEAITAYEGK